MSGVGKNGSSVELDQMIGGGYFLTVRSVFSRFVSDDTTSVVAIRA